MFLDSRALIALCGLVLLSPFAPLSPQVRAQETPPVVDKKEAHYEWKAKHDPNGIGKFYMGREIAYVMGHPAAVWLERPEREEEEAPKKLLEVLKIQPGMTVVDLGAGSGYYSFRMSPLVGEKGKIVAVDIQKEMLDIMRDKIKVNKMTNIELVLGKEADPCLADNSVDMIMMVDVYHEFEFPREMMDKMVKSLKPNGQIVFVEFRLEDEKVPIKLVHKMSERQVQKEMGFFPEMEYTHTAKDLPWQHVLFFKKLAPKEKK